ncbi:Vesicle-associated membrane-protein-associated protein [Parasponia andersonii]|uniref:Vesicle-associated membrane-protein-associated protein n=1 Tax=Parasponia andersonii TaxID=3476 RepID=A0A2P5DKZ2_PARAD|nr:Vesicle-associated membrane-protein-associated protein [Parasponia andersonii]
MSKLLEIQPKELKFTIELKKPSSCSVRLANNTNNYVAFKVKTTSPKRYCVRPNVGIVMPNSAYDFIVTMQMLRTPPQDLDCKDKFLIQSTVVSAETTDEDITASMFVKDGGKLVEEKKLRVILISPPHSPTLSPINGDLNQGPGHDFSFFKNQSLSGVETLSKLQTASKDTDESAKVKIKESQPVEDTKLMPVKNVEFKLEKDVKELKSAKDVELKSEKYVEELKPAKYVEELNPAKYVEELKPPKDVEELKPAKDVEELNSDKDIEELKPAKDVVFKTVEGMEELKPAKDVELKNVNAVEDLKLFKDVEEIKLKLSEFEFKLYQAEVTISKLMEDRNSNIEERKILQGKLAELSKRGVKTVQVGFPLLFVCMVAFISVVLGYRLHP